MHICYWQKHIFFKRYSNNWYPYDCRCSDGDHFSLSYVAKAVNHWERFLEDISNSFKFAGGYFDASGYEQFGVRYYSPSLGRWTQQDPLAGSLFDLNSGNRYVYANDDPVNQVDPSGRFSYKLIYGLFGIPTGILVNLTPQDIYNLQVNGLYAAAILTILSFVIPAAIPAAAVVGVLVASATEIGLYSSTFCGGGNVNVSIEFLFFTSTLSCG